MFKIIACMWSRPIRTFVIIPAICYQGAQNMVATLVPWYSRPEAPPQNYRIQKSSNDYIDAANLRSKRTPSQPVIKSLTKRPL